MKLKVAMMIFLLGVVGGVYALPAHAGGAVGISTWYSAWHLTPDTSAETDPGLLYGPVFSVDVIDKWSLAGVFLTGELPQKGDYFEYYYRRYDCDLTANYNYTRYVKFFGGVKFVRFDWELNGDKVRIFRGAKSNNWSAGPALGIGLTYPVADSLFAMGTFSGLYTSGKQSVEDMSTASLYTYGFNSSLALAYYIEAISSTVTLGGRYQYVRVRYKKEYEDQTMRFYGVTLSMVYHFSTGG